MRLLRASPFPTVIIGIHPLQCFVAIRGCDLVRELRGHGQIHAGLGRKLRVALREFVELVPPLADTGADVLDTQVVGSGIATAAFQALGEQRRTAADGIGLTRCLDLRLGEKVMGADGRIAARHAKDPCLTERGIRAASVR